MPNQMTYQTNQELPADVRDRLSDSAQTLYRIAYNSAIQWYGDETKAHQIAWNAVRSQAATWNGDI
jgi:cation transport regulator